MSRPVRKGLSKKALSPSASETLKDKAKKAVEGVKETVKKAVDSVPNF